MKNIYQVKVSFKIGDIESECFATAHIEDDGSEDGREIEVHFDTLIDFVDYRVSHPHEFATRGNSIELPENLG